MTTEPDFYERAQIKQARLVGVAMVVVVLLACVTFGLSTLIAPLGVQIDAGLAPGTLLGGSDRAAVTLVLLMLLLVVVCLYCVRLLFTGEYNLASVIMLATLATVVTVGSAAGTVINPVITTNGSVLACVDPEAYEHIEAMATDDQVMMAAVSVHGDQVILSRSPDGVLSLADTEGRAYRC